MNAIMKLNKIYLIKEIHLRLVLSILQRGKMINAK